MYKGDLADCGSTTSAVRENVWLILPYTIVKIVSWPQVEQR